MGGTGCTAALERVDLNWIGRGHTGGRRRGGGNDVGHERAASKTGMRRHGLLPRCRATVDSHVVVDLLLPAALAEGVDGRMNRSGLRSNR